MIAPPELPPFTNLSPGRRSRARVLELLVLALVVLAGSGSCQRSAHDRPNVVVILIDTLRADHLPFYGHTPNTAPFLQSLANRGVVFEHARSTSSWTAPATASLFTSLYPTQHGVREGFRASQVRQRGNSRLVLNAVPEEAETIGEAMKKAGYETSAVTDNINISPMAGFGQGFDHFWYTNDAGAKVVNARLKEQLETIRGKSPYFLYIHYMDPHRPYRRNLPLYQTQADSVRDEMAAYDSEIGLVDTAIAQAFQMFGWDKNTLLIVTADHGEEFQDHGHWDHGRTLFGEVMNIPLLIYSSADSLKPGRLSEPVSLLDVLPTLRDYAGLRPGKTDQGISLLPAARGQASLRADRVLYADLHSAPWFGSKTLKAVTRENLKYIWTLPNEEMLFDLSSDPGEKVNLMSARGALAADERGRIEQAERSWVNLTPATAALDLNSEQMEKLRSLGYIN